MTVPPLPTIMIEPLVRAALLEDLGRAGDITTDAIVPSHARGRTALVARQPGIVAGLDCALLAFRLIDPEVKAEVARPDGSTVAKGETIATISGPDARHPHRRARRAQFPVPSLRHRLGGGRGRALDRGARARGWCARARPCPACARCRNTRCASAAASTTASGSMTAS